MGDIIDLNAFFTKAKDEQNERKYTDESGDVWKEYAYSFECRGKSYGYGIWARDIEEAQEMLFSMSQGKIDGEVFAVYSAQEE